MTNNLTRQQIVTYGQSHGYSPKEINKVLDQAKNNLVNYGINAGYKGSEINKVLNTAGHTNYNPLTAQSNWQNLGSNIARNAREIARDMRTIGGVVIQPFTDVQTAAPGQKLDKAKESFMKAINNDTLRRTALGAGAGAVAGSAIPIIGTAGGAITGGLIGLLGAKNLGNAIVSPYEVSGKDVGNALLSAVTLGNKGSIREGLGTDILQGAMRNPLYSGIDILSAGGAKALGGAGRAIGKAVPMDAPMVLQQLAPSPAMRDFSRNATNAFQASKARTAEYLEPLEKLGAQLGMNNEELAKYLVLNEGNLVGKDLDIAKSIKNSIRNLEEKVSEYGFMDKNASRTNVVAQYGMQKLMPVIPDLLHGDLVKYINDGKLSDRMMEALTKNPDLQTYLDKVITDGKNLYDSGDIAFVSQAKIGTTDPRGEVLARAIAKQGPGYFGTNREIGRATIEDYSKVLDESLAHQQAQSVRAIEAMDVVEDILKQPGLAEEVKDINNIPKGKSVINVKQLRDNLRDAVQAGTDVDVSQILKDSNTAELGAYLIPNVYFEALDNMFKPVYKGTPKDVMNAFKKTVLASPHWVALNRIGNWTNNAMGGVKPTDYTDAVANWKLIPKPLKAQTSFNSYVGDSTLGITSTVTTPMKNITKELKKFGDSNKGLGDIGRLAGQLWSNTSNIFSNPMFRLEASMEATDRFANFIRQAKREAKATKQNWKDIVKKSNTDTELFNKLNTQVNKDLGDYVGRNYLIPNKAYEILSATVPFYRFLSQTGRTSLHQLANHPLAFQSTVMAPAKAGRQFSEDIIQRYGLDPEKYEGGVPYTSDAINGTRFIGAEPLPFGAVASDILGSGDKLGLLAPGWTTLPNVLSYKTNLGTLPSSPGLTEYKRMHFGSDKGYEPTQKDRLGYALSQLLNTYYAPSRMLTGWGREAINNAIGKPTLSLYDANMMKINPESYAKEIPVETIGKWFGIQNRKYSPKFVQRAKKPTTGDIIKLGKLNTKIQTNTQLLER